MTHASTSSSASSSRTRVSPAVDWWLLLACAGAVLGMALGTRHVQGLFMLPMLADTGWGRESFAFAAGLQTLVWGLMQALTGWVADRFGTARVIASGCLFYAAGLVIESLASSSGVRA